VSCRASTPLFSFCLTAVKPASFISCAGAAQSTLVASSGLISHQGSRCQHLGQHFSQHRVRTHCKEGMVMLGCTGRSANVSGIAGSSQSSPMQQVSPDLGSKATLRPLQKKPCVIKWMFFLVFFPVCQSRWARMQGSAGAAYQLTPSWQQTDGASAISVVNLISNIGGVEAKLSSY